MFITASALERHVALLQGDFEFAIVQSGQLLVAFGDARVETLLRQSDETSRLCLSQLCDLLAVRGYAVAEDTIFTSALEFWSTFVETMADAMPPGESNSTEWTTAAMAHVTQAVSKVWRKAAFPPAIEFGHWDSSERIGFTDARKDIGDFLQSVYTVAGPDIVFTFAELAVQTLRSQSWTELEAAMFCLGSLADCTLGDDRSDAALRSVFESPLFDTLQGPLLDSSGKLKQTCAALIEKYSEYFERNAENLAPALNLLFAVVSDPLLGVQASRSIHRLCSSCRTLLAPDLGAFLSHYRALSFHPGLDCQAHEKIVGAIACVIQAVDNSARRLEAVQILLEFPKRDAEAAVDLLLGGEFRSGQDPIELPAHRCASLSSKAEYPQHMALKALRCLASIGKGLQALSDVAVDLETGTKISAAGVSDPSLAAVHDNITSIISQLQNCFPDDGEIVETICTILRAGFSESAPGPFVFRPRTISAYFTRQTSRVPRIGLVVSTACSFVSSVGRSWVGEIRAIVSEILSWVIGLLQQISSKWKQPQTAEPYPY